MVNIGQSGCRPGRRVAPVDTTRTRGSVYGWQRRPIMVLLLVLTETCALQVKVSFLLFLLLLNLEFLVDLIEFFEGNATRATCRASR